MDRIKNFSDAPSRITVFHIMAILLLLMACCTFGDRPAHAQVPTSTVYTYPGVRATYSAAIVGMTPAASATDLFTIQGAANKVIRVTKLQCTGTSTALGSALLQIVKRSTADSGGTATNPAAIPHDKSDVAAVATIAAYTANPTLGTSVGVLRVGFLGTGTATALGSAYTQDFGSVSDKQPVLRSAADQLAVNANAASLPTGAAVSCTVEWTESAT